MLDGCRCAACAGAFSRGYLRHLVRQGELTGMRLLTLHNLRFLLRLTDGARAAVADGTFTTYKRDALERIRQWDP